MEGIKEVRGAERGPIVSTTPAPYCVVPYHGTGSTQENRTHGKANTYNIVGSQDYEIHVYIIYDCRLTYYYAVLIVLAGSRVVVLS